MDEEEFRDELNREEVVQEYDEAKGLRSESRIRGSPLLRKLTSTI